MFTFQEMRKYSNILQSISFLTPHLDSGSAAIRSIRSEIRVKELRKSCNRNFGAV